jgi:hypothetical protein
MATALHHASVAVPGHVIELCGASSSGKSQLLYLTAVAAVIRDPSLCVALVSCSAIQSAVSRLRSLVVSLVKQAVDAALASRRELFFALPRAAAAISDELVREGRDAAPADVEAALRMNVLRATEEETAACLQQIHLVQLYDAGRLLLFLRCLSQGLPLGKGAAIGDTRAGCGDASAAVAEESLQPAVPTAASDKAAEPAASSLSGSALVDPAAVAVELAAAASHARRAAEAVASAAAASNGPLWVMVDGLGTALAAAIGGHHGHHAGHALLASVGRALHVLSRSHGVAVLVTNSVVPDLPSRGAEGRSGGGGGGNYAPAFKPALGVTWASVPDTTLLLSSSASGGGGSGDAPAACAAELPAGSSGVPLGRVAVTILKSKISVRRVGTSIRHVT